MSKKKDVLSCASLACSDSDQLSTMTDLLRQIRAYAEAAEDAYNDFAALEGETEDVGRLYEVKAKVRGIEHDAAKARHHINRIRQQQTELKAVVDRVLQV